MEATEAGVRQMLDEWTDALAQGDSRKLIGLMSEDLVHTDPMGVARTRDEVIAGLSAGGTLPDVEVTKDDVRVKVYGSTAVVTGRTTMQVRAGAHVHRGSFRFTDVMVHDGRRWTIVATHTTGIVPPTA